MRLQVEKVTKQVGAETHLYNIDITFEPGLTVLMGQTLSGKTSLLRLMAGLDRPTRGRILVDGHDVTNVSVQKRNIAMVYQQFINYPSMTVYNNIASPLKLAGLNKKEIERRVREVAEMLHIEPLLERLPSELSGGQQQRTAIARALVKEADLLFFDEPLVNLDYKLREELRTEMREIFKRRKAIVVYATTEPVEALLLGGNAVVLDAGRVMQQGPTIEVYHAPASARVGEVFSDPPMNMIDGAIEGNEARLGDGVRVPLTRHLAGLASGHYRFGVRANHLSLAPSSADDVEIAAVTELAEVSGSETFIHIALNGVSWVVQEEGVHSLGLDKEIRVFVDPQFFFVFDGAGHLVAAPTMKEPRPSNQQQVNNGTR